MADSDSNGKSVCELPSSLCKKAMDRPHGGIALFGPGNELMGEMKNRLKLRMTRDSESKKESLPENHDAEHRESSSYDNTSSSISANSSPRSSTYDDVEQSETKNVSDILMNRARKPPTRKPTLNRRSDILHQMSPNSSNMSNTFPPDDDISLKTQDGLAEFFNCSS